LPYGADGGWGEGPLPEGPMPHDPSGTPLHYGVYTSVLLDDTTFWNLGGNGQVPYGAPRPPHDGPPDLVDNIQTDRAQLYGGGPGCQPSPDGAPVALNGVEPPSILPSAETTGEKQDNTSGKESKEPPAAEKAAPPE
jgi:hypothetical protein